MASAKYVIVNLLRRTGIAKFLRPIAKRILYLLYSRHGFRLVLSDTHVCRFSPDFFFSRWENFARDHNGCWLYCVNYAAKCHSFFDVGAHVGIYSIPVALAMQKKNTTVICFEPSAANCRKLETHISMNRLSNVEIVDCLVGDRDKEAVDFFCVPHLPDPMGSRMDRRRKGLRKITARQISLDSFCDKKMIMPDVIKIDVEGAELDVMKGAMDVIKKFKPLIFLSVHPRLLQQQRQDLIELNELISGINYVILDDNLNISKCENLAEYVLMPQHMNKQELIDRLKG